MSALVDSDSGKRKKRLRRGDNYCFIKLYTCPIMFYPPFSSIPRSSPSFSSCPNFVECIQIFCISSCAFLDKRKQRRDDDKSKEKGFVTNRTSKFKQSRICLWSSLAKSGSESFIDGIGFGRKRRAGGGTLEHHRRGREKEKERRDGR